MSDSFSLLTSNASPTAATTFFGVVGVVVGLVLCFFGVRSLRLTGFLVGFALAGALAGLLGADPVIVLIIGIAGGIAGFVLFILVFRFGIWLIASARSIKLLGQLIDIPERDVVPSVLGHGHDPLQSSRTRGPASPSDHEINSHKLPETPLSGSRTCTRSWPVVIGGHHRFDMIAAVTLWSVDQSRDPEGYA
jgi:hypothetical protein